MLQKMRDQIYDTNYRPEVRQGGFPLIDWEGVTYTQKQWFFDRIVWLFVQSKKSDWVSKQSSTRNILKDKSLEEQLLYVVKMDDEKYNDEMLTPELRKYILEFEAEYVQTLSDYKEHMAPSYREITSGNFNISWVLGKTYYTHSYPSYIDFLWTRDMLWFYAKWDMTWFIYPADDSAIKGMLKRRSTMLKAELSSSAQKWITSDTDVSVEYKDVESIRQKLATREEKYFQTSMYTTIYEHDEEKLREESKKFEQKVSGFGVRVKQASQRMDEGLQCMLPLCIDDLDIPRSTVTTSLAGSFPFISNDLIENKWILYGINLHSWSLVIFDRFSKRLPNANSLILATSGAGKSFAVKLEILRYLLLGIDVIVIDPENEYKSLAQKVDGTYVNISISSQQFINPFDLPPKIEDIDYKKGDLLRSQIMNLISLIDVLVWWINAEEEALLDQALQATYQLKEISFEDDSLEWRTVPQMEDLLHVLEGMTWWEKISIKLSKYVSGTFGKIFNNKTNVDLDNALTVFSIRDLEDALKTPAMFNILNYIWTSVRSKKKKRLLVVDEAWIMMQQEVSANFLYQLIKRARKYGLGVTTITQDVEDFISSKYWKPIVSNASMQLLLKQSTSSIASLEETFGLSEAEKQQLVASNIGEWLLFAGNQHVAVKILASPDEKEFITTDVE